MGSSHPPPASGAHVTRHQTPVYCGIMGATMSTFSVDDPAKAFLNEHDFTAVSFWIISIAMIAATVFFYAEAATVSSHWKTSLHVGGLVTLVAGVHGMYMREYWVSVGKSPIVYRYIDWSITVPLQMIEFNLILQAAKAPIGPGGFWRLLVGTVAMLAFGYAGETKSVDPWLCFFLGLAGWAFILFEIFAGESATEPPTCQGSSSSLSTTSVSSLAWDGLSILQVTPLARLTSRLVQPADFVNKIAFVLVCWFCAKSDSVVRP